MYLYHGMGQYDVTVTAPAPEDVPYMPMEIPSELELPEEKAVSWQWLALPLAALLFLKKR